ncbi:MAG: hypothetical protein NTX80_00010 [Candidatus Saccharibacteria bacterium]|nr:hypothetical protein [Candidatus Saccharibacteria bacterium]
MVEQQPPSSFKHFRINSEDLLSEKDSRWKEEPLSKPNQEYPFWLVRPTGLRHTNSFLDILKSANVTVDEIVPLKRYEELALKIYPIKDDNLNSRLWLPLQRQVVPKSYNSATAIVFGIDHLKELDNLEKFKKQSRRELGIEYLSVQIDDNAEPIRTWLHPNHSSDASDLQREYAYMIDHSE